MNFPVHADWESQDPAKRASLDNLKRFGQGGRGAGNGHGEVATPLEAQRDLALELKDLRDPRQGIPWRSCLAMAFVGNLLGASLYNFQCFQRGQAGNGKMEATSWGA